MLLDVVLLKDGLLLSPVHSEALVLHRGLQLLRLLVVFLFDTNRSVVLIELRGVVDDVEQALLIQLLVVIQTSRDCSSLRRF